MTFLPLPVFGLPLHDILFLQAKAVRQSQQLELAMSSAKTASALVKTNNISDDVAEGIAKDVSQAALARRTARRRAAVGFLKMNNVGSLRIHWLCCSLHGPHHHICLRRH